MVVERAGEELQLTGTLGTPTAGSTVIRSVDGPTPEQTATWRAWLNQP
jgi:hypothetical protein